MARPHVALATRAGIAPFGDAELRLVQRALTDEGVDASTIVWTDPHDPAAFDAIVIRSTWDYPERVDRFLDWVDRAAKATALWNPAPLVRWNVHKSYLLDLARRGVAIPPTRLVRRGSRVDLAALMAEEGWTRAVIKPAVGVTSIGAMLVDGQGQGLGRGQAHLDGSLSRGDALVQDFLPSVPVDGELSMFAFDGEIHHAVRKRAKAGDYRVQSEYGGTVERAGAGSLPTAAEIDLARRALAATPHRPLYARVDVVRGLGGEPTLMELEAIEPYLYFDGVEQARPYARAIASRLTRSP